MVQRGLGTILASCPFQDVDCVICQSRTTGGRGVGDCNSRARAAQKGKFTRTAKSASPSLLSFLLEVICNVRFHRTNAGTDYMANNVLLVGCRYAGPSIPDTQIEVLGLCRPSIDSERAAYALYEYDVIIINPQSYSHFIFGKKDFALRLGEGALGPQAREQQLRL